LITLNPLHDIAVSMLINVVYYITLAVKEAMIHDWNCGRCEYAILTL